PREILQVGGPCRLFFDQLFHGFRRSVEGHDTMPVLQKPARHVGAHPAKPHHSKLHRNFLLEKKIVQLVRSARPLAPSSPGLGAGVLEKIRKFTIVLSYLNPRVIARDFPSPQIDKRVPETGPAHGETDESWNASRRLQPFAHFFIVFASAENNATHFV